MRSASPLLYASVFFGALLGSALLTPVARVLARSLGISSTPDGVRHHVEPVSLLGGLAIYGGAFLGAWLVASGARDELKGFFIAGLVIAVSGVQDDISSMDPWLKTMSQAVAALVLVGFGVQVNLTHVGVVDVALTVVWVVVVINAVNYQDNMNGLASGLCAVSSLGFFALAAAERQYLVGVLALGVAGSCAGFLRSNYPEARIFMGDAGAMFLGLVLAFLGIRLRFLDAPKTATFMVPAIIMAVPLFDAALVTVSRIRRGIPITQAGTDHVSHRLVRSGLRPAVAVALLWAAQALCAAAAFAIVRFPGGADLVIAGVLAIAAIAAAFSFERASVTALLPRRTEPA